jgi:hypothetical protein
MKTTMGEQSPLAMMLEAHEHLQLRHSLPTRSGPVWWRKPTLQLSIGLLPLLPRVVDRKRDVLCLGLSASKTKLQPIR